MKKIKFKFENIFVLISILFLISCVVYFGNRLIKYYKIFNPTTDTGEKVEVLAATILKANPVVNKDDGLYIVNGDFVFKGESLNNYVLYSDKLWRVLRVNRDNTVKLILEEPLTDMVWDSATNEYGKSSIYEYITNEDNIKLNNKENIVLPIDVCLDKVDEASKITCTETLKDQFISLPSIGDYINSIQKKSFISNVDNIWLYSLSTEGLAWNIDEGVATVSKVSKEYSVKVVITLKSTNFSNAGDGTVENPYVIEEDV